MKAVVKARAEPGLWLEEVPVPTIGGGDVLIRVLKASICGTDVHIYNWDAWAQKAIPVPMIIGHEFVGVVVRVGDQLKGFARVVVSKYYLGHWITPLDSACSRFAPRDSTATTSARQRNDMDASVLRSSRVRRTKDVSSFCEFCQQRLPARYR